MSAGGVLALIVGGVALGLLLSKASLGSLLAREWRAWKASNEAARARRVFGPVRACEVILEENRERVEALEAREREEARKMIANPEALARFLVRVGEKKR